MTLIKSLILSVWLASVSSLEIGHLNSSASKNSPILYSHLTQILEECYSDASNPIAVTANLADIIYNLNIKIQSPILVINENFISMDVQLYYTTHPLYILSVDTIEQLKNLLELFKSSPFWSMKSTVFVIGNAEKFCGDSAEILRVLWKFELLSSFAMCSETRNQTMIYTFNPYTNRAPDPWVAVNKTDTEDQRWTLYKTQLKNVNPEVCKTLNFDRTEFMDGYPANIIGSENHTEILEVVIFPSLNMSLSVDFYENQNQFIDLFELLLHGERDFAANIFPDYFVIDNTTRIPVINEVSYVIVTQKRSFMSPFREIAVLIDYKVLIVIFVILLLIFFVIAMNDRHGIGSAFFDVFKLLLDMGMDSSFSRWSMKFLFLTASYFMFAFAPTLQSQLLAFMTRPQSHSVETLEDLYNHQYHVYFHVSLYYDLMDKKIWTTDEDMNYLYPVEIDFIKNCSELTSKNSSVACIFPSYFILREAVEKNLHVSSNFVFIQNFYQLSRKGWALNERYSEKLVNVVESGFLVKDVKSNIDDVLKKKKAKERIDKVDEYEEINEDNLYYAYLWFAFCLILGFIAFIIEHLIARFEE